MFNTEYRCTKHATCSSVYIVSFNVVIDMASECPIWLVKSPVEQPESFQQACSVNIANSIVAYNFASDRSDKQSCRPCALRLFSCFPHTLFPLTRAGWDVFIEGIETLRWPFSFLEPVLDDLLATANIRSRTGRSLDNNIVPWGKKPRTYERSSNYLNL